MFSNECNCLIYCIDLYGSVYVGIMGLFPCQLYICVCALDIIYISSYLHITGHHHAKPKPHSNFDFNGVYIYIYLFICLFIYIYLFIFIYLYLFIYIYL